MAYVQAELKRMLHDKYGFNIVKFDAKKVRLTKRGHRKTGDIMLPLSDGVEDWLLEAERWGVAMSTDAKCDGVILLDWDHGVCPSLLWRFMSTKRVKVLEEGLQTSLHGIVVVQGADRARCRQFVKLYGAEGLEVYAEKRNIVLFGEYDYEDKGVVKQSRWQWKDDQAEAKQEVVKVVTGDELLEAGLRQKSKKKNKKRNVQPGMATNTDSYLRELVDTGPESSRHGWCWDVGRCHIDAAGGDITADELADKIVGSVTECASFVDTAEFVKGGARYESDVWRTAKDLVGTYDTDKSGVVKTVKIRGETTGRGKAGTKVIGVGNDTKIEKIKYHDLAYEIMDEYDIISTPVNKVLYWFDNNCWYPCERNLESVITAKYAGWDITPSARRVITEIIKDYAHLPVDERQSDDVFDLNETQWVFNNGQLDVMTGEFKQEVSPQLRNTIKMPFDYDPGARCPVYDKVVQEWCDGDARKVVTLDEAYALAMMRDSNVQVAHFVFGVGLNGKSTWLRVLCAMLPVGRYSDMSIAEMAYDNFWGSSVYGKMLIMSGDGSAWTLRDVSRFKKLVGKDEIAVEFKNQNKFTYKPKCHVIQTFNELPTPLDRSNGFYRKVQLVEFSRVFEINQSLEKQLVQEVAGIFNRVLPHIRRLIKTGMLQQPYTLDETRKIWGAADDYVKEYVEKYIADWASGAMVPLAKDVFVAYQQEYEDPNKIDMSVGAKTSFGMRFNRACKQLRYVVDTEGRGDQKKYVFTKINANEPLFQS